MRLFDKRSNTERLLDELPWLWAVSALWSPVCVINIRDVHEGDNTLAVAPQYKNFEWWIKVHLGELHRVHQLDVKMGDTVAEAADKRIPLGDRIDYIVERMTYEKGEQRYYRYDVFRSARKNPYNLNQMLGLS